MKGAFLDEKFPIIIIADIIRSKPGWQNPFVFGINIALLLFKFHKHISKIALILWLKILFEFVKTGDALFIGGLTVFERDEKILERCFAKHAFVLSFEFGKGNISISYNPFDFLS